MTRLEPTNFKVLAAENSDIIISIEDGDSTGRMTSRFANRYTIRFADDSKLYVTEILKSEKGHLYIDYYHYDWKSRAGTTYKWHSEPHDRQEDKTVTEPYHIHAPNQLGSVDRLPNFHDQNIHQILATLRFHIRVTNVKM